MRVIFLTHYFPPEVGAPQARIAALARGLSARGLTVTVHTCPPHYPDGVVRLPYRNRLVQRESVGHVRVVRSLVYPALNRGFTRRLANHTSFAASALATAPAAGRADVVVAESPPLFLAAAAIGYARMKRAALVVNVADRWPLSAVELGALDNASAIRAAEWLERRIYRAAARVTVPTRGLADSIAELPSGDGKVRWLPPSVDVTRFTALGPRAGEGPLEVLYAGTVGLAQGVETLVEAAALLGPERVRLTIAGDGAAAPQVAAAAAGLSNVRSLGTVAHEEIPALYAAADVAVVPLRDRPLFAAALPTKLLEGLAAARPVVLSARGEAADLIRGAKAGLVVPPENAKELAAAFELLRRDPAMRARLGAAGRALAERQFGRDDAIERWEGVLREAVAVRGLRT